VRTGRRPGRECCATPPGVASNRPSRIPVYPDPQIRGPAAQRYPIARTRRSRIACRPAGEHQRAPAQRVPTCLAAHRALCTAAARYPGPESAAPTAGGSRLDVRQAETLNSHRGSNLAPRLASATDALPLAPSSTGPPAATSQAVGQLPVAAGGISYATPHGASRRRPDPGSVPAVQTGNPVGEEKTLRNLNVVRPLSDRGGSPLGSSPADSSLIAAVPVMRPSSARTRLGATKPTDLTARPTAPWIRQRPRPHSGCRSQLP